jgi:hypothetical protein
VELTGTPRWRLDGATTATTGRGGRRRLQPTTKCAPRNYTTRATQLLKSRFAYLNGRPTHYGAFGGNLNLGVSGSHVCSCAASRGTLGPRFRHSRGGVRANVSAGIWGKAAVRGNSIVEIKICSILRTVPRLAYPVLTTWFWQSALRPWWTVVDRGPWCRSFDLLA